jgi:hypothetical protein
MPTRSVSLFRRRSSSRLGCSCSSWRTTPLVGAFESPAGTSSSERTCSARGWTRVLGISVGGVSGSTATRLEPGCIIGARSQWDWYVSRLGAFIAFAMEHAHASGLSRSRRRELSDIGFKSMSEQLGILEAAAGTSLGISAEHRACMAEMALVRNLILHNRGEVDLYYLGKTSTGPWQDGDIRTVTVDELHAWHRALVQCINRSAEEIAKAFAGAPEYPEQGGGT